MNNEVLISKYKRRIRSVEFFLDEIKQYNNKEKYCSQENILFFEEGQYLSDERLLMNESANLYSIQLDLWVYTLYYLFIEKNIQEVKQYFYLAGKMGYLRVKIFNSDSSFDLKTISAIILSDNLKIINQYSNFKSNGGIISFIQAMIREDWEYLDKEIIRYEQIFDKGKSLELMPDIEFCKALKIGNIQKMEEAILLLATKYHRKRTSGFKLEGLISIWALTYAKIAYLKGYELNIDNKRVPKELLPAKPNKEYWEYDFMKEGKYKDV